MKVFINLSSCQSGNPASFDTETIFSKSLPLLRYLLIILLICLFAINHSRADDVYENIIAKRLITVATDANWPPQSYFNEDNIMDGFDADVAREIARRMGVEIKFVTPAWDLIVAGGWNGQWDLHVGSMKPTHALAKKLDFPAIYYFVPASVAVHKNSTFSSISQLSGKRIGIAASTAFEHYLKGDLAIESKAAPVFSYQINNPQIISYEASLLALDDLRSHPGQTLDAVISARPEIMQLISDGHPLKVIGDPVFYEPLAVAIDIGNDALAQNLTDIINWMHKDGTLSRLSRKWYGVDYSVAK